MGRHKVDITSFYIKGGGEIICGSLIVLLPHLCYGPTFPPMHEWRKIVIYMYVLQAVYYKSPLIDWSSVNYLVSSGPVSISVHSYRWQLNLMHQWRGLPCRTAYIHSPPPTLFYCRCPPQAELVPAPSRIQFPPLSDRRASGRSFDLALDRPTYRFVRKLRSIFTRKFTGTCLWVTFAQ